MTFISDIMDGVVFAGADGNIAHLNAVAEQLLGVKSFMAIGRPFEDLPADGELVDAIQQDLATLDRRGATERTIEVHHSEEDLLYIRLQTSRISNCGEQASGTLCVLRNVTADYKSDQLKNQYLSIVAHELRTPLTGIKTFSTMMAQETLGKLTEQQLTVAESIREQSLRLEQQIDKLINLGNLDSDDRYGQDLERFSIHELVSTSLVAFQAVAAERGIEFVVDCEESEREVEGDRSDLRRAIQAIVENAVKFTPDGGKVHVAVENVDVNHVRFSVRDTGPGIDPRYHRRIFEKFFQVEDPLTRHHGGAGLGLFFAREIVEAHGAELVVESELGEGAHFCFVLPFADRRAGEAGSLDTRAASIESA